MPCAMYERHLTATPREVLPIHYTSYWSKAVLQFGAAVISYVDRGAHRRRRGQWHGNRSTAVSEAAMYAMPACQLPSTC